MAAAQLRAYGIRQHEEALRHALSLIETAAHFSPDIIVLPECSYPAYLLDEWTEVGPHLLTLAEVLDRFAQAARKAHSYVAVGIVEPEGERLFNSLFLLDRTGAIVAKARKHFLWHFDRCWFKRGCDFETVAVDFGRVGLFVCADGRIPEVPRLLALKGAEVLLDATNWVTGGWVSNNLANMQADYLMQARAAENGVALVAANKVGVERHSIRYCGKSQIVSPEGELLARAGTDGPEVITAELDLNLVASVRSKRMALRGPQGYPDLGRSLPPVEEVPSFTVGLVHADGAGSPVEDWLSIAQAFGIELLIRGRSMVAGVSGLPGWIIDADGNVNVQKENLVGLVPGQPFDIDHGKAHVAILKGMEGRLPEPGRVASLRGADLLVWINNQPQPLDLIFARTRAAENHVYVALISTSGEAPSALLDPEGRILSAAEGPEPHLLFAAIVPAFSRAKQIVPGTHLITDRYPPSYAALAGSLALQRQRGKW